MEKTKETNTSCEKGTFEHTFYTRSGGEDHSSSKTLEEIIEQGKIKERIEKGIVFWIDLYNPNTKDIGTLAELLSIHPLTAEDIQTKANREKCELYDNYLFLCIQTLGTHEPPSIYLIMFSGFIITIHFKEMKRMVGSVIKRLEIGLGGGRLRVLGPGTEEGFTSDWIMYCILDDVVDQFIPEIRLVEVEVDTIEDLVLVVEGNDRKEMIQRIAEVKKKLTGLLRLLKPKREILSFLNKHCPKRLMAQTELYIRDIQDNIITMIDQLDSEIETTSTLYSNYLAYINIEMTHFSNQLAVMAKKLNVWASILLPSTLVTGLWGMNVPVPGQSQTGFYDWIWFFLLCAFMFVGTFWMYFAIFKRNLV